MNGICGILRLDGQVVDRLQLSQCFFQSPQWVPDHQAEHIQQNIGFICTQRFTTFECSHGLMPFQQAESGCMIIADVHLTNRPALLSALSADKHCADVELILAAYLKWGYDCPQHLQGLFYLCVVGSKQNKHCWLPQII